MQISNIIINFLLLVSQEYAGKRTDTQPQLNVPTRSPLDELNLKAIGEENTTKKKISVNDTCNDAVNQLKNTFKNFMETLQPINTLSDLINWYHKENFAM